MKAERTAGILTVEEGGVLNGRLSRLDDLYENGVRLVTLTWNYENCIGYPNSRDKCIMEKGLTDFGIQTVERMNELGMIVDVSHLSDAAFGTASGTADTRSRHPFKCQKPSAGIRET